ncbi:MAG: asparagine synthase (glutamine-hydrolyzing) [Planctomycetota bacterium JB042]
MCGICGAFARRSTPDLAAAVGRMTSALAHRGPDDEGEFHAPGVALGFRRLAVVDLSPAGNQPHAAEDGGVVAVVNGEIDNHAELRAELRARGRTFRSTNDAEVVPHLYAELGDRFVERLDGMFALAVLDRRRRRLLLARDRLGKKPLVWREEGDVVWFASEGGALRRACPAGEADPGAIVRFLTFGVVPAPHSAVRGERRLPPGSLLVADADGVRVERWWSPPAPAGPDRGAPPRPISAWKEELRATLATAVSKRLRTEVPLGVFLSGGIDSGLVLAALRDVAPDLRPPAFTIGFDDAAYDERRLAAATAERFGAEPVVELLPEPDPTAARDAVAATYDEPFGDPSAVPTLHLCRLARRRATVVLSGDGGDEPFAGYRRHRAVSLAARVDRVVPRSPRGFLARIVGEAANGTAGRGTIGSFRRFAGALGLDAAERTLAWQTFFRAPQRARFLHADLLAATAAVDPEGEALAGLPAPSSPLRRALSYDLLRYLPDDLLVKVDRASMAVGLEVRSPWLDPALVALAARLPTALLNGRGTKTLPRALAADLLPGEVARGRKRGFGVPLARWLRGPMREEARRRLLSDRFAGRRWLADGAAAELLDRHASGREDWSSYLWLLLVLDAWARRWVDREAS